jgi:rhodanese-related sulfurtransferase
MKRWILLTLATVTLAAVLALPKPVPAESPALELSAPEAQRRADAGELILIDVRTPEEWQQTGVPAGAKLVSLRHPAGAQGFVDGVLEQVGGDRQAAIGVICRTGNRSGQAQGLLAAQGFAKVYNIREGMAGSAAGPGWIKRGLPLVAWPTVPAR